MMMEEHKLEVESRELTGKGPARRLRMAGKIPAILYGMGDHKKLSLNPVVCERTLLQEGGKNQLLTVKGAGLDGKKVMVKDYQVDPVSRKLLHVDLFEIDVTEKVEVTVALNFIGKCKGVVDGGILNVVIRDVEVKCLADKIPNHIDVDVTNLNIGDSVHLEDLALGEGLEKASQQNPTIVTVVPPSKEEELTPALEAGAAPEVITEKKDATEGAAGDKADDKGKDKGKK